MPTLQMFRRICSIPASVKASPTSVDPSPLPTPHSHAPSIVPPLGNFKLSVGIDFSIWFLYHVVSSQQQNRLFLCRLASNDPSSNFIPSTLSASDQHHTSQDHSNRATHLVDLNPMPYVKLLICFPPLN